MEQVLDKRSLGEARSAISTGLVRLHRHYYAKGPNQAKTDLVGDTVISVLQGGFTAGEESLIENGHPDLVYDVRRSIHAARREEFKAVVEQALDRPVAAYVSQVFHELKMTVEIFVLEPEP